MTQNKILEATTGLVALLEPLQSVERGRVIQAALLLLGESDAVSLKPPGKPGVASVRGGAAIGQNDEKEYFESKQPASKIEELAVAARFREEALDAAASSKEELKAVVKAARRNFDDKNFPRDMNNARTKGLFNRGADKDGAVLSHYGQNYVDALPDRDAVNALRKPGKGRGSAKKAAKKSSAKKA